MAQQYPPASPFGTQYGPAPTYYPPYQQHGVQQPSHTPPVFQQQGQHPPGGFQSSPGVNAGRFEANAQIRPVGQPLPFPPAPFTSDMFRHFGHSNIPPPPPPVFPPVPFPQVGFPHPQLMPTTPSAYPQKPVIPGPTPGDSTAYDPRFPQGIPPQPRLENPFPQNPNIRGEEIGVADAEVNGSFLPRSISTTDLLSQQPSPSFQPHHYNFNSTGIPPPQITPSQHAPYFPAQSSVEYPQSASSTIGNMTQTQGGTTAPFNRPASGASYKPPSPSLPQTHSSNSGFETIVQSGGGTSKILERSYEKKTVLELRQLAKSALLSLVPHNIHFSDLLKEGVDRSVLQHLYDELGMKIDTEGDGAQPQLIEEQTDSLAPAVTEPVATGGLTAPSSVATPSVPKPPLAISPGLERKDRIAQLLAAKTGRPSPVRSAVDSVPVGNTPNSSSLSATLPAASMPAANTVSQETPSVEMQVDVQPTTVTRAALVRQKTDPLRKEAVANAQGENQHTGAFGSLDLRQLQDSHLSTISLSDLSTPAREELMQNGFASLIPGLFMTSADITRREQISGLNNDSLAVDGMGSPKSLSSLRKRPFASTEDDEEDGRNVKRPDLSVHRDDEEMHDPTPPNDDVSEGEVVETDEDSGDRGTGASDIHSTEHSAMEREPSARSLASNDIYRSKMEDVGGSRKTNTANDHEPQLKRSYSQLDSPKSSDTATSNPKYAQGGAFSLPTGSIVGTTIGQESSANPAKPLGTRPLTRLTPAQIAEKAASLKAEFLRQRAQRSQRQKALQDGLPDLNEEVRKTQSRLAEQRLSLLEIKRQIQNLDLEVAQARKSEEEIVNDISRLENLLQQGISGQKQYSDELRRLKTEQPAAPSIPSPKSSPPGTRAAGTDSAEVSVASTLHPTQDSRSISHAGGVRKSFTGGSDAAKPTYEGQVAQSYGKDFETTVDMLEDSASQQRDSSAGEGVHGLSSHSSQQASTKGLSPDTDGMMGDREDDSDGSASMSDSGSDFEDEYEPAADDSTHSMDIDDAESDEYDPEEVAIEGSASESHMQEEAYDDESGENLEVQRKPGATQDESFVQSSSSSTGNADSGIVLKEASGQSLPLTFPGAPSTATVSQQTSNAEHVPQISQGNTMTKPQDTADNYTILRPLSGGADVLTTDFKPYESPLNAFKAFRYNPQFDAAAKDGFRSLTYSNNIDPAIPLCPTELSGNDCTDSTCEEQHFRHLGLSDDKILVQMSSANDITDKAMRERYLLGLRQVIADLRQKGVKEFESVANALSFYRRQFYADQDAV